MKYDDVTTNPIWRTVWYADGMQMQIVLQGRLLNKIPKFFKFKMADGRHIENGLLAISRRMLIRLMRNFVV